MSGYLLLLLTAHCIMGYVVILTNIISTIAKHFSIFKCDEPHLESAAGWLSEAVLIHDHPQKPNIQLSFFSVTISDFF